MLKIKNYVFKKHLDLYKDSNTEDFFNHRESKESESDIKEKSPNPRTALHN